MRETQRALVHHKRCLMQLATGGGKTVVAGKMAQGLARSSNRTIIALYLVHRTEIADQAYRTLCDFGLKDMIGRIQPRQPESRWKKFQIASIPTLYRRLESVKSWLDPMIVFVDEAHHCRAETWEKVLDAFPNAYLLGMTATPARLDGKGLGQHFAKIVFGPSIGELTRDGWLAPVDLYVPPAGFDLNEIRRNRDDYSMTSADRLVTGPVIAKEADNWVRIAGGMKTIHYAVTIRHSMEYCGRMAEIGARFEHIDGGTDPRQRVATLRRLENGSIDGVSNVDVLTEGFDCPDVQCVHIGRPTRSMVLYRQMNGRGMRPKADGAHCVSLDSAGNVALHGPLDDFVQWSLEDGVIEEREDGEGRSPHRHCKNCDMLYPISKSVCPNCGAAPETKTAQEVDVDLIKWGPSRKTGRASERELAKLVTATGGDRTKLDAIRREYGIDHGRMANWERIYAPIWASQR